MIAVRLNRILRPVKALCWCMTNVHNGSSCKTDVTAWKFSLWFSSHANRTTKVAVHLLQLLTRSAVILMRHGFVWTDDHNMAVHLDMLYFTLYLMWPLDNRAELSLFLTLNVLLNTYGPWKCFYQLLVVFDICLFVEKNLITIIK